MRTTGSARREKPARERALGIPVLRRWVRWLVRKVFKRQLKAFARGHGLCRAGATRFYLLFCLLGYS